MPSSPPLCLSSHPPCSNDRTEGRTRLEKRTFSHIKLDIQRESQQDIKLTCIGPMNLYFFMHNNQTNLTINFSLSFSGHILHIQEDREASLTSSSKSNCLAKSSVCSSCLLASQHHQLTLCKMGKAGSLGNMKVSNLNGSKDSANLWLRITIQWKYSLEQKYFGKA